MNNNYSLQPPSSQEFLPRDGLQDYLKEENGCEEDPPLTPRAIELPGRAHRSPARPLPSLTASLPSAGGGTRAPARRHHPHVSGSATGCSRQVQPPREQGQGSLLEDSYVMRDPFTSDKGKFLILGSECRLCCKRVCVGTDCSLFYTKRFCLPCINSHLEAFPLEIRQELQKRTQSKSQSSQKEDSREAKKK